MKVAKRERQMQLLLRPEGKKGYVIETYYEVEGDKIKQCYEQVKE